MPTHNKPPITVLNDFTKIYLDNVRVVWASLREGTRGEAHYDKGLIKLSRNIPSTNVIGCRVGSGFNYNPDINLDLIEGEQYFYVLLHEIAHFKIRMPPSKEFVRAKACAIKELHEQQKAEEKNGIQTYPKLSEKKWHARYIDEIIHLAPYYLKRKSSETNTRYETRLSQLESYIAGDNLVEHIKVEDWTVREFVKRRRDMRMLLKI